MDKLVNLIIEGLLTFVPGKWLSSQEISLFFPGQEWDAKSLRLEVGGIPLG
jgi:hypothetical protein